MSTLIVTAHPDTGSLTHQAARQLREALGPEDIAVAHLAQEGFDPRFTAHDRRDYLAGDRSNPAIRAEQQRIDAVDHVVLVFPVYWWSLPALLKGWIDRVFITGWAFDFDDKHLVPKLGHLTAHLLPISGTAPGSFARHGYAESFRTQIEHGVLDYCGIQRGTTAFVYDSEAGDTERVARDLHSAVTTIASAITGHGAVPERRDPPESPAAPDTPDTPAAPITSPAG